MSKTSRILFTLSVALNVLIVGVAAGHAFKVWHDNPWRQTKESLSPEGQKLMTQSFGKMRKELEPLMQDVRLSRQQIKQLLLKDDFDSRQFDKITSHIQDVRDQMADKFIAASKEVVSGLKPDERKVVAEKFVGSDWKRKRNPFWACPSPFERFGPFLPGDDQGGKHGGDHGDDKDQ